MSEHENLSSDARTLLQHACAPRSRTESERRRSAKRITLLATGMASPWWASGKALASVMAIVVVGGLAGVLAMKRMHPVGRIVRETSVSLVSPSAEVSVAPRSPQRTTASILSPASPIVPPMTTRPQSPAPPAVASTGVPNVRATRPHAFASQNAQPIIAPVADAPATGASVAAPAMGENECLLRALVVVHTDPNAAMQHVSECERLFPSGAMIPEREMIAIESLRALGRTAEARGRAERILARFPNSIYSARIRRLIDTP